MESADHVLAKRVIHAGLAAHRRIHLRKQRGRDLDEWHAALVSGGREAGHVADHTATQGNQRGLAVASIFEQRGENVVQYIEGLVHLAIREQHLHRVPRRQLLEQPFEIKRRDGGVRHHRHPAAGDAGLQQAGLAQQPLTDVDRVTADP